VNWKRWVIVGLVIFTAGWMLFDGTRALIAGDYVTPQTGEYAGQLGPWAALVGTVGIEPRSTLMKSIFVVYGAIGMVIALLFARGVTWARTALITACALGLWYVPFGTLANVVSLILLSTERR
jgi:hypothetical protein